MLNETVAKGTKSQNRHGPIHASARKTLIRSQVFVPRSFNCRKGGVPVAGRLLADTGVRYDRTGLIERAREEDQGKACVKVRRDCEGHTTGSS